MNAIVNTEKAKLAAEKVVQEQVQENEKRKFEFEKYMNVLAEAGEDITSFDEIAAILPDIAPK